jgi:hypothetical protein
LVEHKVGRDAVPTIAVFAEILIIGLEAAAWVILMVLAIFGKDLVHTAELRGWETLVTLLILASAYVLGVLVDRAANSILNGLLKQAWFRKWLSVAWLKSVLGMKPNQPGKEQPDQPSREKPEQGWPDMRLTVMAQTGGVGLIQFLEYLRSRVRIARGTTINFFLIALSTLVFGFTKTSASKTPQGIGLLLAGVVMLLGVSYVSLLVWSALDKSYIRDLYLAHQHFLDAAPRSRTP